MKRVCIFLFFIFLQISSLFCCENKLIELAALASIPITRDTPATRVHKKAIDDLVSQITQTTNAASCIIYTSRYEEGFRRLPFSESMPILYVYPEPSSETCSTKKIDVRWDCDIPEETFRTIRDIQRPKNHFAQFFTHPDLYHDHYEIEMKSSSRRLYNITIPYIEDKSTCAITKIRERKQARTEKRLERSDVSSLKGCNLLLAVGRNSKGKSFTDKIVTIWAYKKP